MERKYISQNIAFSRKEKTDSGYIIEGYACHWDKPNHNGEIVTKTTYDNFFKVMQEKGQFPSLNLFHLPIVIGVWDAFETDNDTGLYVKGRIEDTNFISKNYVLPLIECGALRSLSTEGLTNWRNIEETDNGILLKESVLTAVSVVSLPADFDANFKDNLNLYRKRKQENPLLTLETFFNNLY